jgi:hypothetical protein
MWPAPFSALHRAAVWLLFVDAPLNLFLTLRPKFGFDSGDLALNLFDMQVAVTGDWPLTFAIVPTPPQFHFDQILIGLQKRMILVMHAVSKFPLYDRVLK